MAIVHGLQEPDMTEQLTCTPVGTLQSLHVLFVMKYEFFPQEMCTQILVRLA